MSAGQWFGVKRPFGKQSAHRWTADGEDNNLVRLAAHVAYYDGGVPP